MILYLESNRNCIVIFPTDGETT